MAAKNTNKNMGDDMCKTDKSMCGGMCKNKHNHCGSAIYCFGVIGAAVYFVSKAVGFWGVVMALIKAVAWPAFVVYGILKSFGL